jgi:hypothetical protein
MSGSRACAELVSGSDPPHVDALSVLRSFFGGATGWNGRTSVLTSTQASGIAESGGSKPVSGARTAVPVILDAQDEKLLAELRQDGRTSVTGLAAALGCSQPAASRPHPVPPTFCLRSAVATTPTCTTTSRTTLAPLTVSRPCRPHRSSARSSEPAPCSSPALTADRQAAGATLTARLPLRRWRGREPPGPVLTAGGSGRPRGSG